MSSNEHHLQILSKLQKRNYFEVCILIWGWGILIAWRVLYDYVSLLCSSTDLVNREHYNSIKHIQFELHAVTGTEPST